MELFVWGDTLDLNKNKRLPHASLFFGASAIKGSAFGIPLAPSIFPPSKHARVVTGRISTKCAGQITAYPVDRFSFIRTTYNRETVSHVWRNINFFNIYIIAIVNWFYVTCIKILTLRWHRIVKIKPQSTTYREYKLSGSELTAKHPSLLGI